MTRYKIGIIADTHVPEFLPQLPSGVEQLFGGVDLILHAGDITGMEVLEQLRAIAPVEAVKGDHDRLDLELKKVVELGGVRIGLLHGRRPRWQEAPSGLYNMLYPQSHSWGGFQHQVLRAFDKVDAIVFGHFHRPYAQVHRGVLLFNPGAVYHVTAETIQARLLKTRSPLQRIYLQRALLRAGKLPTVGMFTIEDGLITPQILPLGL